MPDLSDEQLQTFLSGRRGDYSAMKSPTAPEAWDLATEVVRLRSERDRMLTAYRRWNIEAPHSARCRKDEDGLCGCGFDALDHEMRLRCPGPRDAALKAGKYYQPHMGQCGTCGRLPNDP